MDEDPAAIEAIAKAGEIEVAGKIEGIGKVALATTSLVDAVRGANLIMIVVPANAHGLIAEALAAHVRNDQIIVLHPGGTGGVLELATTFRRLKVVGHPLIAEVESFMYGSRKIGPARVQITAAKRFGRIAALPARDTERAVEALQDDYSFVAAKSVLTTSLTHMNAMLHVPGMVMNAGWVETTKGEFDFFRNGLSPAVARIIEGVDAERMAVSDALGAEAISMVGFFKDSYQIETPTLFETIQTVAATIYKASKAPASLTSRYLSEDVPTGLVPIAALGEAVGVRVPLIGALIDLTSHIHGVDHWTMGRTWPRWGLREKSCAEIQRIAIDGHV